MTGLLVSVRRAEEADAALRGGATLIDVKEPHRGSLGRADREVWQAVATQVRGRVPVSVACGELTEWTPAQGNPAQGNPAQGNPEQGNPEQVSPDLAPSQFPARVQYAKCGMAGCLNLPAWQARWHAWRATLPAQIQPVAVIYADACRVAAPPAHEVLAVAAEGDCHVVLWDTCIKDGTHLLDHVAQDELDTLVHAARYRGMLLVLAGSLSIEHIPAVMRWRPDYLAVRGAVCQRDRTGSVCPRRVARFVQAMSDVAYDGAPRGAVSGPVNPFGDPTSVA